jgi:hypothetical protein
VQITARQQHNASNSNKRETTSVVHRNSMRGQLDFRNQDRTKLLGTAMIGAKADALILASCP